MKFLLAILTAASLNVFAAEIVPSKACDLEAARGLGNEQKVLAGHEAQAARKDGTLTLHLGGKMTKNFDDKEGGAYDYHRVVTVTGDEVTLFEPRYDSQDFRVVHLKSGREEMIDGCPVWSPDGHYFASISEDGGSGRTPNEALLWYCEKADTSCKKIWNGKTGGRDASWSGSEVAITTVTAGVPERVKIVHCRPQGASAHCEWPRKARAMKVSKPKV